MTFVEVVSAQKASKPVGTCAPHAIPADASPEARAFLESLTPDERERKWRAADEETYTEWMAKHEAHMSATYGRRPGLTQLAERELAHRSAVSTDDELRVWIAESGSLYSWAGFTDEQVREAADRLRLERAKEDARRALWETYLDPQSPDARIRADMDLAKVRRYGSDADVDDVVNKAAGRAKQAGVRASSVQATLARSRAASAEIKRRMPEVTAEAEAEARAEIAAHRHELSSPPAGRARARQSAGGPRRATRTARKATIRRCSAMQGSASASDDSGGGEPPPPALSRHRDERRATAVAR